MQTYPEKLATIRQYQKSLPVQTVALAEGLGLKVWHVPDWPNDLSGKILKSTEYGGPSGYAIFVNKNHAVMRRRFTTAHEIAHFILHLEVIGDGIVDDGLYRSSLSNSMEAQANRLAADILMPWHLLSAQIEAGVTDPKRLAQIFNVSESAMSIRIGAAVF